MAADGPRGSARWRAQDAARDGGVVSRPAGLRWSLVLTLIAATLLGVAVGGVAAVDVAAAQGNDTGTADLDVGIDVQPADPVVGEPVTFFANVTGANGSEANVRQYDWSIPGEERTPSSSHASRYAGFQSPGNYTVELTVVTQDDETATADRTVRATDHQLEANLTIAETAPLVGEPVTFDARTSLGAIENYTWRFGSTSPRTTETVNTFNAFDDPGNHTVELTVTDGNATDTVTRTVAVEEQTAAIEAAIEVTPNVTAVGEPVTLNASGTNVSAETYFWAVDGEWIGSTDRPVYEGYRFQSAATNVTVTAVGENATDSATATVTVPDATLTDDAPVVGQPIAVLVSPDSASEYRWDFGDGTTVHRPDDFATHTYEENGTYTIQSTVVTHDGGTATVNSTVTVREPDPATNLSARLNASATAVETGERVNFSAAGTTGDVDRFIWGVNGEFTRFAGPNRTSSTFVSPGTYTVSVVAVGDAAVDRANATVEVQPPLAADLAVATDDPTVGEPVTLDASGTTGGAASYEWSVDGEVVANATGATLNHTFEAAGSHAVQVTAVDGDGDRDSANATVDVEPPLAADLVVTTEDPTAGESVTLDASDTTGDVATYEWTVDGDVLENASGPTLNHTFDAAGSYGVQVTAVDQDGDRDAANATVDVEEPTVAAFSVRDPSSPAQGESFVLDASNSTGDLVEYRWTVGNETVTTARPLFSESFTGAGTHTIELTVVDDDGETDGANLTVQIPEADLEASLDVSDTDPVAGQPVSFRFGESTGPIEEYRLDVDGDGNATTVSGPSASHVYTENGTYTAELTVVGAGNETASANATVPTNTATVTVTVAPDDDSAPIEASVEADATITTVGEPIAFDASNATGNVQWYHWDYGDDWTRLSDSANVTSHTYHEPGEYEVALLVANESGVDATTLNVTVQQDLAADLTAEPASATAGESVTLNASADGDAIDEVRWAFGDNATERTNASGASAASAEHAYDAAGNYTATATLVGPWGATANATVGVDVAAADDDSGGDGGGGGGGGLGGGFGGGGDGGDGGSGADEAAFEVASVDVPDEATPREAFDVTVEVENVGDASGTATATVELDGEETEVQVDVDAGATGSADVGLLAPDDPDEYDVTVSIGDASTSTSLTVSEEDASDGEDAAGGDGADESSDDGNGDDGSDTIPGFGVLAALVAALAAAAGLGARSR